MNLTELIKKWDSGKPLTDKELKRTVKEVMEVLVVLTGKGGMFDCELRYLLATLQPIQAAFIERGLEL